MVARSKMREIPVLDDLIASAIDRECHSLLCTVEHDSNGSVLRDACEAYEDFIDFDLLIETGMIAPEDVHLFKFVETAEEGWAALKGAYGFEGIEDVSKAAGEL